MDKEKLLEDVAIALFRDCYGRDYEGGTERTVFGRFKSQGQAALKTILKDYYLVPRDKVEVLDSDDPMVGDLAEIGLVYHSNIKPDYIGEYYHEYIDRGHLADKDVKILDIIQRNDKPVLDRNDIITE